MIGETNTFLKVVDLFSQKKNKISKNLKKINVWLWGLSSNLKTCNCSSVNLKPYQGNNAQGSTKDMIFLNPPK